MALSERLAFLITANATDAIRTFEKVGTAAERDLKKAEARIDKFGAKATNIGAGMVAFAGVAGGALALLGDGASDLNESISKSNAVFGENAAALNAWADDAATAFGQSKRQALEAASTYGNLFQAFGVGREASVEMSKSLVQLAADLASFNNTSVDDALLALRSGLSGETEPLKRFGVALTDARMKEEALRLGLIETTTGVLPAGVKAQAAYALIMKDTALAQGDFARTSGGLANQQRILAAQFQNMKDNIGSGVLPVMINLIKPVNSLVTGFNNLGSGTQKALGTFATFTTIGAGTVGTMALIAGQARKLQHRFTVLDDAGKRSLTTMGKWATGLGSAAVIGGVALSVYELAKAVHEVTVNVQEAARATTDELVQGFLALESFRGGAGLQAFEKIAEGSTGTAERLRDALKATGYDVSELDRILEEEAAAQRRATADAATGAAAFEQVGSSAGYAAGEVDNYGKALDSTLGAHLDLGDAGSKLADVEDRVRDSLDGVGAAASGATEKVRTFQDAMDEDFTSLVDADLASERLIDSTQALAEALGQAGQGSESAADFMDRFYNGAADSADEAGQSVKEATANAVKAAEAEVEALVASGEIADTAEARKAALRDRLVDLAEQFPAVKDQIDKYIARLDRIPNLTTDATTATKNLGRAKQDLEQDTRDLIRAAEDEVDALINSGELADTARGKHEGLLYVLTDLKNRFPELATIIDQYIQDVIKAWQDYLIATDPGARAEAAQGRNRAPGNPQPGDTPINPTVKSAGVTVVQNISGDGLNSTEVADLSTKRIKRALVGSRVA